MPKNWSKIRDEWLSNTAIPEGDAKWALDALVNSEEEFFEIERRFKNKEDTILSDNAMNISGGQKQRILLARSLYRSPEILLLDESTNALNEDLEQRVLLNIKKFFPKITILLVTHRTTAHNGIFSLDDDGVFIQCRQRPPQ